MQYLKNGVEYNSTPNISKNGFLLINKPSGPTSHDVINELRKITLIRQIGHAGTLDPFAEGLLLVGIGEATKLLRHYVGLDKTYEATLRLGAVSDTYDRTGKITNSKIQISNKFQNPNFKIKEVLKLFIGKQKQIPPMYSAKKIGGKKLYELARQGQTIERKASEIEIYDIKLFSPKFQITKIPNTITISCRVSSGTYIRTLAHDIGQKLGTGAYLEELKRTAIGEFRLEDAVVIAREGTPARGNLTDAKDTDNKDDNAQRDDKIAALMSTFARNDTVDWRQRLIPLKTVLVSGTFDRVHEGHRNYFQQARQYGQRLICIVGRDKIVEQIKGQWPHYSEKERVHFVKQCPEIDRVYLGLNGPEDKIYDFTASLKPDIIALGYDQTAYTENLAQEMKKRGLNVAVVRMKAYHPEKYKASILHKKTRA